MMKHRNSNQQLRNNGRKQYHAFTQLFLLWEMKASSSAAAAAIDSSTTHQSSTYVGRQGLRGRIIQSTITQLDEAAASANNNANVLLDSDYINKFNTQKKKQKEEEEDNAGTDHSYDVAYVFDTHNNNNDENDNNVSDKSKSEKKEVHLFNKKYMGELPPILEEGANMMEEVVDMDTSLLVLSSSTDDSSSSRSEKDDNDDTMIIRKKKKKKEKHMSNNRRMYIPK